MDRDPHCTSATTVASVEEANILKGRHYTSSDRIGGGMGGNYGNIPQTDTYCLDRGVMFFWATAAKRIAHIVCFRCLSTNCGFHSK